MGDAAVTPPLPPRLACLLQRLRTNAADAHESCSGCEMRAPEARAPPACAPHTRSAMR
jgi:hypothetical protein